MSRVSPAARRALRLIVSLAVAAIAARPAEAQPPSMPTADTSRARMAPLKWLVGQWEGPATVTSGGRSFTLTQRETVLEAANGTVLLIQGREIGRAHV